MTAPAPPADGARWTGAVSHAAALRATLAVAVDGGLAAVLGACLGLLAAAATPAPPERHMGATAAPRATAQAPVAEPAGPGDEPRRGPARRS